ncbi:TIR domain-containing protein, partial [Luteolibacter pohnpeiensis]
MSVNHIPLRTSQMEVETEALLAELGRTYRERIRALLPLFHEGKASLSDALAIIAPDKDRVDAQKAYQNHIVRVNAAAADAELEIRLAVDSDKHKSPEDRFTWIEGPSPDGKLVDSFTKEAASTVESIPVLVPPSALILTRDELENPDKPRRPLIKFFVSYAHADDKQVLRLQNHLLKELKLSKRYQFEVWHDRMIEIGDDWIDKIKGALDDCHLGLLFVSRDFLISESITKMELPALVSGGKPVIPVGLTVMDFARINMKGLEEKQIFRLSRPGKEPRFFSKCQGVMADEFVQQLASRIEDRVTTLLTDGSLKLSEPKPHSSRRLPVAPEGEDPVPLLEKFIIDGTRLPDSLIEPEASTTGLDRWEKDASLATANRTLAVDYLADWATSEDGTAFCAVLGELGIGKTTTLMMLAREMQRRRATDPTVPPVIFIDLKDYEIGERDGLEEILACVIRRHWKGLAGRNLTPEVVLKCVREKGALLIFDGLDERIIPLPQAKREAFIRELWRALPPLAQKPRPGIRPGRLIISCRSHYFPSITALSSAFTGEMREGIREKSYTACIILPFCDEQIRQYLRGVLCDESDSESVCEEKVKNAITLINSIHNLSEPATRPFLLSLIAPELAELESLRADGCTVLGVTLYGLFVDKWLARDAGKHQFTPDHKIIMMQALAAHLQSQNQKMLSWTRISKWLDSFLAAHPAIRDRYMDKPAEVLNQDFRAATMVLRPDSEKDGFRFAHSSLGEYFLALHLALALEQGDHTAWDLPMASDETFDFLGQLLAAGEKVETLLALVGWSALLDDPAAPAQARRAAFRAWLVAHRKGWPQPSPVAARLDGLDLENWEIGLEAVPQLDLRGACLEKACLDHAVLRRVLLTGARADGASARLAEFHEVTLSESSWEGADFSGGTWRGCDAVGLQSVTACWHDCDVVGCNLSNAALPDDWSSEAATNSLPFAKRIDKPSLPVILRQGHGNWVSSVCWSPDGTRVVSGGCDKTVKVWDAVGGRCLLTLEGHGNWVSSVCWS